MDSNYVPLGRRGDPWFDDGNIILVPESESQVAFKVHRGVLSRHSEVFQSMFDIPQPASADGDPWGGCACQVILMYDLPVELSNLIKALYDGATFKTSCLDDFFYLAGILRLSTKYFILHLRTQAIRHLTQTWSFTLRGHDDMVELALKSPLIENMSHPYVHPIHVLNLAREVNVRIVVPSAMYFLSLYPLTDILRADHPKLVVKHPSRPLSQLSTGDIEAYTLMFQHRLDVILDFVRRFVGERVANASKCQNHQTPCTRGFARLAARLSRSWKTRTGPLHYMMQAVEELSNDGSICVPCRRSFREDVVRLREDIWDNLPAVVGSTTWDDLKRMDLPP